MTYAEIYKGKDVSCGFKKGDENQAKKEEVRKKISDSVKASYTEELREVRRKHLYNLIDRGKLLFCSKVLSKDGKSYSSKLEAHFSGLMFENSIEYKSQYVVKLVGGGRKIVDFCLPNRYGDILVEITGYAHEAWRKDFQEKMLKLRKSVDNQIMVLTYPEHFHHDGIFKVVTDKNLYVGSIFNNARILKTIQFCIFINKSAMEDVRGSVAAPI